MKIFSVSIFFTSFLPNWILGNSRGDSAFGLASCSSADWYSLRNPQFGHFTENSRGKRSALCTGISQEHVGQVTQLTPASGLRIFRNTATAAYFHALGDR